MKKILFFSIMLIVMISISPGMAFAHPDTLKAVIMNDGVINNNVKIIGLDTKTIPFENDLEIFSEPWFWQNFILILILSIVVIMTICIGIVFKEELSMIKLIRN